MLLLALPTTDVVARAAIVEGYNSNTYQAQDDPNDPVISRHPSPFTGVDASLEARIQGRDLDGFTLVLDGRVDHFEPLQTESQSDDGGVNGLMTAHLTLGPRTTMAVSDSGSVTSFNASHVTDGTIFTFDPTQVRSSFWVNDFNLTIEHDLAPTWRLVQSLGLTLSGTLSAAPLLLPTGQEVEHRGLDYVLPYVQTALARDLGDRATVDLSALAEYSYALFVIDLTQKPPRNIGPVKQGFGTLLAGSTYHFSPELAGTLQAGLELASPAPRDVDQRPVLGPAGNASVYYTRPFFTLTATGGYAYGTLNPRLGAGPSVNATLQATGVPYHVGKWQNLALIATAQMSYASLVTGVDSSTGLGLYAAGVETRYAVSSWLGLLAGVDVRYASFVTDSYEPPFFQELVFLGLSGYWSTDRNQPPITSFASPVQPPA